MGPPPGRTNSRLYRHSLTQFFNIQTAFSILITKPLTMTTRAKLIIAIFTTSTMSLLSVFSEPLHIPEAFQWALLIAMFISIGFTFYFIRKQKQERLVPPVATGVAAQPAADQQRSAKRTLILMMVIGSIVGLCSPLWLPLTGTNLGTQGNFICGLITAAIICTICGLKLRKL